MTEQEAIKNIEQIKMCVVGACDEFCKYYDFNENCCKYDLETQHNSLDMAIEALEEQEANEREKAFAKSMMSYNKLLEANNDGYNRAKKEEQEKHRWIPVSERMPELIFTIKMSDEVLVTVKRKDMISVEISRTNGYYWTGVGLGEVIAWMPLPEPYKGE